MKETGPRFLAGVHEVAVAQHEEALVKKTVHIMAAMNIKLQGYGTSDGVSTATEKYTIEGAKGSTQLLEAVAGHCAAKAAEHASIPGKAVPYMMVVQAAGGHDGEGESLSNFFF